MKFFGLGMLNKRASLLEAPFVHVGIVEALSIIFPSQAATPPTGVAVGKLN
jgi:hypothetical protein